jgi:hypothetical protein
MIKKLLVVLMIIIMNSASAQDTPEVTIGGAARFNYNYSSWKEGQKDRGGDLGFDVFRINALAKHKGIVLDAEYRFYSNYFGGGMLKKMYLGYDFDESNNLKFGLTQVPFGILPYNSNSWFFSMNFYTGHEDDYDLGFKYTYKKDALELNLAFFKNAEELRFGSTTDVDDRRYAYDIGSIELNGKKVYRNKEINQVNARLVYTLNEVNQIGFSAQYGGVYNLDTKKVGYQDAFALHYMLNANNWGVKAQATYYNHSLKHPDGQATNEMALTAYAAPYLIASEAINYTIGLSYTWKPDSDLINSVIFYNDFGMMDKMEKNFEDSFMNVTGALISTGWIYVYVDYGMGKNQPWIGPEWTHGLASGNPEAEWESRFNINIGYYF